MHKCFGISIIFKMSSPTTSASEYLKLSDLFEKFDKNEFTTKDKFNFYGVIIFVGPSRLGKFKYF